MFKRLKNEYLNSKVLYQTSKGYTVPE